ncbi:hypothetical protein Gohar_006980 [Gossypium harknessii]|uniref:2-C-methyl-D-erythritol 2,4-cyclodiphosphate synthase n=1 Tax=Gossypium harknessii TaxID=34285 RepID=A0A7J9GF45_9ROSI|nr:hypothetical protein [Gossypium harknessii]
MATHYYSCCSIPAKPTSQTSSNNSIWLPNHLVSIPRHRNNLVPYLSSAFSLGDSISAAATSVGVDGPTTSTNPRSLPFRVGHGFDLHRLEPGYPLIISGVDIPHDRGCEAHSDGDVLLHCVVDAILGALGLPDIGQIFPDSDPKWKGAASSVFIKEAVNISLIWILDNFEIFLLFIYLFSARSAYENAALEQTSAADSDFLANNAMHLIFIYVQEKPVSYTTSKVMLYADINLCYMLSSRSSVVVFCMYSLQENPC